jgi:hypothetical protein
MGKKSAHTGMSPKDRSINLMDKFISRNQKRQEGKPVLSAIRKDPNISVDMWPLKDQIEYWETRTDADRFNDKYTSYSTWYSDVRTQSSLPKETFMDFTVKLKIELQEMFDKKLFPKQAVVELKKHGVY